MNPTFLGTVTGIVAGVAVALYFICWRPAARARALSIVQGYMSEFNNPKGCKFAYEHYNNGYELIDSFGLTNHGISVSEFHNAAVKALQIYLNMVKDSRGKFKDEFDANLTAPKEKYNKSLGRSLSKEMVVLDVEIMQIEGKLVGLKHLRPLNFAPCEPGDPNCRCRMMQELAVPHNLEAPDRRGSLD
jgi:hypothetical protein